MPTFLMSPQYGSEWMSTGRAVSLNMELPSNYAPSDVGTHALGGNDAPRTIAGLYLITFRYPIFAMTKRYFLQIARYQHTSLWASSPE